MEVVFGQKERRKAELISQFDLVQDLSVQLADRPRLLWIVIRDGKDTEPHWLLLNRWEIRDRVVPRDGDTNNGLRSPAVPMQLGLKRLSGSRSEVEALCVGDRNEGCLGDFGVGDIE